MQRLNFSLRAVKVSRLVSKGVSAACILAGTGAYGSDLHDAARLGDAQRARALIETGARDEIDSPGRDSMTPLLWAVQANDLETVRVLLAAGADAGLPNRYGVGPLWLAATNRSPRIVALLLEHGAKPQAAMPHGETPLMAAARSGDVASLHLLLEAGSDPNARETSLGETALMWAAAENHAEAVRALVAGGADPDLASDVLDLAPMDWVQIGMVSTVLPVGGWPPLLTAARENASDAAAALIESGADPNIQDPDGLTALHVAIMNAHYDLAVRLLELGANPNTADRTGMSALYGAVDMATLGSVIGRPKVARLDRHDVIDVVRLLLEHGADPNARLAGPILARHHGFPDRSLAAGATALMRAVKGQDSESIRLLIDAGASADLRQDTGTTALHMLAAARAAGGDQAAARQRDMLDLLLEGGAELDAVDRAGQAPLHLAAQSGNARLVEWLVERGARLDIADPDGRTPLDVVSMPGRGNNPAMAELLRRLAGE